MVFKGNCNNYALIEGQAGCIARRSYLCEQDSGYMTVKIVINGVYTSLQQAVWMGL